MRIKHIISALTASVLIVGGCNSKGSGSGCTDDYSMTLYKPSHATGFTIESAGGASSLVSSINPWQGADSVKTTLLVSRDGEGVPVDFTGQVLKGDARRIVTMSSTQVAMLEALGADSLIVGVSGIDFISNRYVNSHRDRIADIGYDGNINYEALAGADPDLVLLYGVNGASSMEAKLTELGIPYMYIGDYLEQSPLGKAEWMVALAEVTGRREEGKRLYEAIPRRYEAVTRMVAGASDRPVVMINAPYGDTWFMPSADNYMVRLINDAGGCYVYGENTGNSSEPIDLEKAYLLASKADVWINPGDATTMEELRRACPKFMNIKSVGDRRVYNNVLRRTPAGGNDFYESAVTRPDAVLLDMVKILHPELAADAQFTYYLQLK